MDRQDWEFYLSAPLSMERRIFKKKKKKFFSEGHRGYYAKDLPIYLRYCVFIREIWVPLRNETVETGHWAHCSRTGNDNRRCAQHSGHFVTHFASSAATIPSHHYCRPIQFTRFIFFSPPLPSYSPFLSTLVIDLRTSLSEIKLHTYELTGTGKPVQSEISIFAKFSFHRILNYVQLFISTSISNEISGYFEEKTIL